MGRRVSGLHLPAHLVSSAAPVPDKLDRGTKAYNRFAPAVGHKVRADAALSRVTSGLPNGGMVTDPKTGAFGYSPKVKATWQYRYNQVAKQHLRRAIDSGGLQR